MRKKHTFYTLKVWLTTLLVSPILWFIVIVCVDKPNIERVETLSFVSAYMMIVLFTAAISSFGWFIFWGIEWLAYKYLQDIGMIKGVLFIGVQLIIIGTLQGILFYFGAPFAVDPAMLIFLVPYGTVAGISVWYYQLEPKGTPLSAPAYEDMAQAEQV